MTVVTLPEATSDTLALVKAATHGVRKTWRDRYRYSKAGVVPTDLMPLTASQRAMPGLGQLDREMGAALMEALDACNRRFGRGAVVPGRRVRPEPEVVDEVRDAVTAVHDESRRASSNHGRLIGERPLHDVSNRSPAVIKDEERALADPRSWTEGRPILAIKHAIAHEAEELPVNLDHEGLRELPVGR